MTGFSSSREELLAALKGYTSMLQQRKAALSQLSQTSSQMHSALQGEGLVDITPFLERRDEECKRCADLLHDGPLDPDALITTVRSVEGSGDLEKLAQSLITLQADSQQLAQDILTCQGECEHLLKSRIEATSRALKQSTQRRKLDAAYGPATAHGSPVFLDKQR